MARSAPAPFSADLLSFPPLPSPYTAGEERPDPAQHPRPSAARPSMNERGASGPSAGAPGSSGTELCEKALRDDPFEGEPFRTAHSAMSHQQPPYGPPQRMPPLRHPYQQQQQHPSSHHQYVPSHGYRSPGGSPATPDHGHGPTPTFLAQGPMAHGSYTSEASNGSGSGSMAYRLQAPASTTASGSNSGPSASASISRSHSPAMPRANSSQDGRYWNGQHHHGSYAADPARYRQAVPSGSGYPNGQYSNHAEYMPPHSPANGWRGEDAYPRGRSGGHPDPSYLYHSHLPKPQHDDAYAAAAATRGAQQAPSHSRTEALRNAGETSFDGNPADTGTATEDGGSPSSSSAARAGTSAPKGRRKRMFKYLTDAGPLGEKDGAAGADTTNGESASPGSNSAAAAAEPVGRKKVKKACLYCKRSHMPCEVARPCARCTKRGIAHLCKEEAETEATEDSRPPKKNKATAPRVRPREETNEKISQPEPGTNDPDPEEELQALEAWSEYKPKLPISLLLSEDHSIPNERRSDSRGESASTAARPPVQSEGRADGGRGSSPEFAYRGGDSRLDHMLDANDKQALEQLLEGGDKVFELSDAFGDKPTGMLSASLGGSTGSTLAAMIPWKPTTSAKDNVSSSASSSSDEARGAETIQNPFLREEALTAAALRGITSYNYTWGYAKLAVWMHNHFSRESCASIDRALGKIRPKFLQISKSLTEKQLLDIEEDIQVTITHYKEHVFEYIPFGMLLLRRTGEIYGANESACRLLQLPKRLFSGGQLFHFQLVKEVDIVRVIDAYAEECLRHFSDERGDWESPTVHHTMEVDRSFFLHDKPALDPRTGQLHKDAPETLEDGSPSVLRINAHCTIQARINEHGLPLVVCIYISLA